MTNSWRGCDRFLVNLDIIALASYSTGPDAKQMEQLTRIMSDPVLQESDQVAKSNRLIEGQFNWSLIEHRIVTMLIAQIDRADETFEMQSLKIKDFLEHTGVSDGNIYDRAEEICDSLIDSSIKARKFDDEGDRVYDTMNPFSRCKYLEGKGEIRARFTKDMRPLLLKLQNRFTTYQLEQYARLSSRYSIRIFELMKMREDLRAARWTVEVFREMLGCQNKYKQFSSFKRRVLETARKEIKETCDIYFTYHVERDGQTPVRITFTIHDNSQDGLIEKANDVGQGDLSVTAENNDKGLEKYDIESLVREDLSQEELNEISVSDLREAVEEAVEEAQKRYPTDPDGTLAYKAHRIARAKLTGSF